jgi:hypothetical protein
MALHLVVLQELSRSVQAPLEDGARVLYEKLLCFPVQRVALQQTSPHWNACMLMHAEHADGIKVGWQVCAHARHLELIWLLYTAGCCMLCSVLCSLQHTRARSAAVSAAMPLACHTQRRLLAVTIVRQAWTTQHMQLPPLLQLQQN